ncbi:MAG: helix-turn-helix domain-containing protein [Lacrimispora saccharolytica]
MDQQKIGKFLKCLRKDKGLTQEQLAEHFCVSSRTVSRWENGNNMPDVDILIGLADFYEVDIRELIDGERKNENMDKETKETVLKAAEYMNMGTEQYTKRVHILLLAGGIFWFVASLISHTELNNNAVLNAVSNFAEGAAIGMILCGIVFTSRYGQRIKAFKQRLLKRR